MDLKALQDEEYKALVYLKDVCEKNNLKLFLRGGSTLGAVKYKDFVPWDDDIDVALPRKDYTKLIDILPERINNDFLFVAYQKTENSHCYFPRIILSDPVREEKGLPKNNERGLVLIDILPIDGMPDKKAALRFHILKAYLYRLLASLWTIDVNDTVSMHGKKKDTILRILHSLRIHKLYKQDDIYRKLDKLYAKYEFGKTRNCGMLASSKLSREIVPYTWWGNGTEGMFRNTKVLLPSNYDLYLKNLFGDDYATYEPAENEKNKSHLYGRSK